MRSHLGCRLYLVRHGETINSGRKCFNGHFDIKLSPRGIKQMQQVANALSSKPIRAIYSSDLSRAQQAGKIIGKPHRLDPKVFSEFRELSVGKWEGLNLDEINQRYPGDIERRYNNIATSRVEGGETLRELYDRVIPKLDELVKKHTDDSVVVTCHGGVNRIILCHILSIPWNSFYHIRQNFAAINIIQFYPATTIVECINAVHSQID